MKKMNDNGDGDVDFIPVEPTLCNKYPNQEVEYIFSVKGRPFGCLTSPHLPTPTSTLLDYNLVRDLGLKMYDLKYQKFTYCGAKMRILGKVHLTAQTIHDGMASGAFHMKATVVLDLNKSVDCECVAGNKMIAQLERRSCTSSGASIASSSLTTTPSRTPPSSSHSSPSTPDPKPTPGRPSPPPSSPPGFPAQPQYLNPPHLHQLQSQQSKPPEIFVSLTTIPNLTVHSANLLALGDTFGNADLQLNPERELRALHEVDPEGRVQIGPDNVMMFRTTQGYIYEVGHGRNRCSHQRCMPRTKETIPNNCGFNRQFLIPYNYKPCGPGCQGALCRCIKDY